MSPAMRRIVADAAFRYIAQAYLDELPEVMHRGSKAGVSAPTSRMYHLLFDKFILWLNAPDENGQLWYEQLADGSFRVKKAHMPPVGLEDPDEWVLPAHEAMKRIRGRAKPYTNGYRWLRKLLAWRGLPCLCACEDIVAHVAMTEHATPDDIAETVISASRECVRKIADVGAMLDVPELTARRVRIVSAEAATPEELAVLPRTYGRRQRLRARTEMA